MSIRKVSGQSYVDNTPNTIFASAEFRFPIAKSQVLDMEHYSTSSEVIPFDEVEEEFTREFRKAEKSLSRMWNVERLKQKPMYSEEDGFALLLPLPEDGNQTGQDWLSYKDPRYAKAMCALVDKIAKKYGVDSKDFEEAKHLLVDYSFVFPYASTLRHDGTYEFKKWNMERVETFGRIWESILIKNFFNHENSMEEYFPKVNATKGLGFYNTWPDGSKVNKFEDGLFFVPRSLATEEPNNIYRYNCAPVKYKYLDDGIVESNLKRLLKDTNILNDPKSYVDLIFQMSVSVHTEAYRNNNSKTPEWDGTSATDGLRRFSVVNKMYSYECEPYMFLSGERDSKKYCNEVYKRDPARLLCINTRRPIFPGPNAQFGVSFTFFFNLVLHDMENGYYGFLSLHDKILNNLNYEIEKASEEGWKMLVVSFDRSNSEQFITDNFQVVKKMFGDKISKIIESISKSIVPSAYGGRYVEGLISGSSPTTTDNCTVGAHEYSNLSYDIGSGWKKSVFTSYEEHLRELVKFWTAEERLGCLRVADDVKQFPTLGTDDQTIIYFYKNDDFVAYVEGVVETYKQGRSLKMEVSDHVTTFGISVSIEGARADPTLGLSKLCLMEKTKNGDACALKMYARLQLLSKYYDLIQEVWDEFKFGKLSSYEKGARNFFTNLAKFGWPVEEFWVRESPKDQIIMGETLKRFNINPITDSIKYTYDQMRPLYDLFKNYLEA